MPAKKIEPIKKVLFESQQKVRIADINYGQHLGHDSLVTHLHDARVQFFRHFGYSELDVCGKGLILANLNIDYLAQAYYPDDLTVAVGVGELTKSSMELIYQVRSVSQEKEIARATTTMVFYDYEKQRVVRAPEEFIQKISV